MTVPKKLKLDEQLCFALYAATNAVTRAYRPLLATLGLTYPQYLVMLVLWQDGAHPISHISQRLNLAQNALTPLLDRLEAAGFVTRTRDANDRRVVQVALTGKGAALEADTSLVQQTVECSTELDPQALAALRSELIALVRRMEDGDRAARPVPA